MFGLGHMAKLKAKGMGGVAMNNIKNANLGTAAQRPRLRV